MGLGVIGFETEGFLVLADGFVALVLLGEGVAEVAAGHPIVRRDRDRMPEKGFSVLPIPELLLRQRDAEHNCGGNSCRSTHTNWAAPLTDQLPSPPHQTYEQPNQRHIGITVSMGVGGQLN